MCFETVGRVLEVPGEQPGNAVVDFDGATRLVSLVMLDVGGVQIAPGDWLLTHTGLAVAKLGETEARTLVEERRVMRAALNDGGS